MKVVPSLWALVILCGGGALSFRAGAADTIPVEEQHRVLRQIYDILLSTHPAPFHKTTRKDFEALFVKVLASCNRPLAAEVFYFQANKLVQAVSDSHTYLSYRGPDAYLPVRFVFAADGLGIIKGLGEFSWLEKSRVLSIQGFSPEALHKKLAEIIPADWVEWVKMRGAQALERRSTWRYFLGRPDLNALSLKIRQRGRERELVLSFGEESVPPVFHQPFQWAMIPEIQAGWFALRSCDYGTNLMLTVRDFFYELARRGYERVILDLRGNSGGASRVVEEFLRFLPGDSFKNYSMQVRLSEAAISQLKYRKEKMRLSPDGELTVREEASVWRKSASDRRLTPIPVKIFILTDGGTFSSGTMLAVMLSDNRLATVVGERTGNPPSSFGDLLSFKLPYDLFLEVSHKIFTRPDPSRDPSDALVPDVEVPTKLEDLFSGRDPQMEWVMRKLHPRGTMLTEQEIRELLPQAPSLPRVVRSSPASGARDVDPALAEIVLEFDQDMQSDSYSIVKTTDAEYPEERGELYWRDPRTLIWPVKLKPGVRYGAWFNHVNFQNFRSTDGLPAEPYWLVFTTRTQ